MSETEKLIRDIERLRESIQLTVTDFSNDITPAGKQSALVQIDLLQTELKKLLEQLWSLDD